MVHGLTVATGAGASGSATDAETGAALVHGLTVATGSGACSHRPSRSSTQAQCRAGRGSRNYEAS